MVIEVFNPRCSRMVSKGLVFEAFGSKEDFEDKCMELVAEAISPLYWRVLKPHWDNSIHRCMPRPYFYQSFTDKVFAYAIPIVKDNQVVEFHEVQFLFMKELSVEKFELVVWATEPLTSPCGPIKSLSVYVVAHHRKKGTKDLIKAVRRNVPVERTLIVPVIARSPLKAVARALSYFVSYLASRLEGFINKIMHEEASYVPNRLYRFIKSVSVEKALYYMNFLYNRATELSGRLSFALGTALKSLRDVVWWLFDVVRGLKAKLRRSEVIVKIVKAALSVKDDALKIFDEAKEIAHSILTLKWRREVDSYLEKLKKSRPAEPS